MTQDNHRWSIRKHLLAGIAGGTFLVVGLGGWVGNAEFSGAVIAPGKIVVDSNVKKVQHPNGGVVRELLVRNGDHVKAGQVLVRLDPTQAAASLAITTKRLDELMARQARAEAERDGNDTISFPAELTSRKNEPNVARFIAGQQKLFEIRRSAREGQKAQLRERIEQLKQEVGGLEAQVAAKLAEAEWIRKELDGVMELWKKNLVPITRVVSLQRDLARAEGERGRLVASIAENKEKVAEIKLQIIQIDQDLRKEVGKDLAQIRAQAAETAEQKIAAADVLARIDILAPQDGIVHEMTVHTIGGVIAAGDSMMMIVPTGDSLDVEAKIAPHSIDQVHPGQSAALRFSTVHLRATPELEGTVTTVSADLVKDDVTNEHYYLARIAIRAQRIAELNLPLVPGMPVEAFIRTDRRTLVSYLVKPLQNQIEKGLAER
jgi:HlyD family secretion protein